MNWVEGSILLFGGLVAVMGLGLPVAFAFLVLNVIGAILFLGGEPGLAQLARNAVGQGRVCRASQDQELVVHFRLRRIVWTPRDHPVRHASSSYRSNKDAASPSRLDGRQFLALRLGLEKIRISYPGARRCSLWRLQRAHGGADDLH